MFSNGSQCQARGIESEKVHASGAQPLIIGEFGSNICGQSHALTSPTLDKDMVSSCWPCNLTLLLINARLVNNKFHLTHDLINDERSDQACIT